MTARRRKILFFSSISAPFVDLDRKILAGFSRVVHLKSRGIPGAVRLVWAALFVDAVFSWFASTYSALLVLTCRLLNKRSLIVVGGADVTVREEMDYGLLTVPWKRSLLRYAIRRATAVVPVSLYLEKQTRRVGDYRGANIHTVSPGLDDRFWKPNHEKETMIVSVAACTTEQRVRVKGIDVLLRAADHLPEVPVQIVGVDPSVLKSMNISVPENVTVAPWIPEDELLEIYSRSRICCQPSRIESFSFALAQGMLCECIPVASRVGGLPEVMGELGYLASPGDPESLVEALARALNADRDLGRSARERIQSRFSLDTRSDALRSLLER